MDKVEGFKDSVPQPAQSFFHCFVYRRGVVSHLTFTLLYLVDYLGHR